jgi:hypothetical protein
MGSVIWTPQSLVPQKPFNEPSRRLRTGFYLALIGLVIRMFWFVPDDLVTIKDNESLSVILSNVSAVGFGLVFTLFLWWFAEIYLLFWRVRKSSSAVFGSMSIYIFLPIIGIPIHALFPGGMSATGYGYIVWILIIFFISWQNIWLGILCKQGHIQYQGDIGRIKKRIVPMILILILLEIALSILCLYLIPTLFKSSMAELFLTWL